MRKILCTVIVALVAVAAMAAGMPRNSRKATVPSVVRHSHAAGLLKKQSTSPLISAKSLQKSENNTLLKEAGTTLWANFIMGYEEIADPGVYTFEPVDLFNMGNPVITNSTLDQDYRGLLSVASNSVVGDGKIFMSSWYGYAAIFDLATKECLFFKQDAEAYKYITYGAFFDEATGLVYGQFMNDDATALQWCSFDLKTQTRTVLVADMSDIAIAGCDIDNNGTVWAVDDEGQFYQMTKQGANRKAIGNLGVAPECEYSWGGFTIDHANNRLYWAFDALEDDLLYPYVVDLNLVDLSAKLIPSNYLFAGMYEPTELVFDKDQPEAPQNVTLARNGDNAVITWDAVTKNMGGETITGVTYNVTNVNTGETVATGLTRTSYTINNFVPAEIDMYEFAVVAVHGDKESVATKSNKVAFGAAFSLPHTFPIEEGDDVDLFTLIDANRDGITWGYEYRGNFTVFSIADNTTRPKDDWVITPPVHMSGDRAVTVKFLARASTDDIHEKIQVKAGKGNTVAAMTITASDTILINKQAYTAYETTFSVPEEGNYNVGIHAVSDADRYWLMIDRIEISEGAAASAPNKVADLKAIPAVEGIHECDIEFKAPTTTVDGSTLGNDFKINVLRGTTLVETIDDCEPGDELAVTDMEVPNGLNTYNVVVVGSNGEPSDTATVSAYVGFDVPRVTDDPVLRVVDNNLVASWRPAQNVGANGHYVDPARVSCNVYMFDPNAEDWTVYTTTAPGDTSVVLLTNCDVYEQTMTYVKVEAIDKEYNFVSAKRVETNKCLYGKAYELPYQDELNGKYSWFEMENSIGTSTDGWQYGTQNGVNVLYTKCTHPTGEAYINTGKIELKGAKNPKLAFDRYLGTMPLNDYLELQIAVNSVEKFETITVFHRDAVPPATWATELIDLSAYKDADWISLQFLATGAPAGQEMRDFQEIANVRIMDAVDEDLALEVVNVTNEGVLNYNSSNTITVKVSNNGSTLVTPEDFSVELLKEDGTVAYTAEIEEPLIPLSTKEYKLVYTCSGINEDPQVNLTAVVKHAGDPVETNNSGNVQLTYVKPTLPSVLDLAAGEQDGNVLLTWSIPENTLENVVEDFDSFDAFSVGEEVLTEKGYTVYFNPQNTEKCGPGDYEHAGEPIGWLVFDNVKAGFGSTGAYGPHSGSQCLVAFDGSKKMDTWLITPELSGNEQTITFWSGCLTGNWGAEEFNVLYSTTGTDKGDFIQINDKVLTEKDSWNWTKREFTVPAGAKYFAIQVVSTDKMGFKVDDLQFEAGKSLGFDVEGYQVSVDGVVAKTVTEMQALMPMPKKATKYGVAIVTPEGVGPEVFVDYVPSGLYGDVNLDGKVDVQDINCILNIMLGSDPDDAYDGRDDVNGDGRTDVIDLNIVLGLMIG
ncbi:MAG: choice-of-anchor J domain-containing protein [Muribaculaceae bacterium]|nr:choice-of-anchor J domain-containing protein [Muribaculaceae bacterium]